MGVNVVGCSDLVVIGPGVKVESCSISAVNRWCLGGQPRAGLGVNVGVGSGSAVTSLCLKACVKDTLVLVGGDG